MKWESHINRMHRSTASNWGQAYEGVKVAVLGATGFIGRMVAREAWRHGAEVVLFVREREKAENILLSYGMNCQIVQVDLVDHLALERELKEICPTITFNLAAYGVERHQRDEVVAYQINGDIPNVICESIRMASVPQWKGQSIVHVGTAFEYGESGGLLSEDCIPRPNGLYGKTKLCGTEKFVRNCKVHNIKGLVCRVFTVYGPGEHSGRLLPSLIQTAKTGEPLELTEGLQKRDFVYVEDVAEGLLRLGLSNAQPGDIVNLATGSLTSVRSFVESSAKVLGIPKDKLLFGAIPSHYVEMEHVGIDLRRLHNLTGWVPSTRIPDGIRKTLSVTAMDAREKRSS